MRINNNILNTYSFLQGSAKNIFFLCVLLFFININHVFASKQFERDQDIVLNFRHPAVGRHYISAIISNNNAYLPIAELLSLLFVHFENGQTPFSLKGTYLYPGNNWYIKPYQKDASIGNTNINLEYDDYRIGNMELFVLPHIFEKLFGMHFTINMNTLNVSLHSDKLLPVEYRQTREQMRRDLKRRNAEQYDYPMLFPRKRKIIGAGMVDYNLGMSRHESSQSFNYNIVSGIEVFGGDSEFGFNGVFNNGSFNILNTQYSWRYVFNQNSYLTNIRLGKLRTTGLLNNQVTGFAISNEPLMPRQIHESIMIDGNTTPDSDVELFVNNQLVDHVRANEAGYYRFDYPLNYGSALISIRSYTPSGEIIIEESQLQIPYSFLPAGVWAYNIQGGINNAYYVADETKHNYIMHGDLSYGLSRNITGKIGVDYNDHQKKPMLYTSMSARLSGKYLLNIDAVPNEYYRLNVSHNFASRRSVNIRYTSYSTHSSFNNLKAAHEISTNLYWPFHIRKLPTGIRFGLDHLSRDTHTLCHYRIDIHMRIRQMNLRINYHEHLSKTVQCNTAAHRSSFNLVLNYSLRHQRNLPSYINAYSIRANIKYNPRENTIYNTGVQLSRSVFGSGRLQISADHDIRNNRITLMGTLSLDLQYLRATSQYAGQTKVAHSMQQYFSGSVGIDPGLKKITASSRYQVGQGSAAVIFFVDENENGIYDIGEEIIPAKAIRLNQGANMNIDNNGALIISHLQGYWTYNAEIVQSAFKSPGLVPLFKKFAFVADPNVFKRVEIPLYRTGVIDGTVLTETEHGYHPLSGVRLLLKNNKQEKIATIRTFSDGGYYVMGLMPGSYELKIDPVQLAFLNKKSDPPSISFDVKALADGHFIEKLNFLLLSFEHVEDFSK